jgi:peptidyl-prolyl cis-trans isomerase SurA
MPRIIINMKNMNSKFLGWMFLFLLVFSPICAQEVIMDPTEVVVQKDTIKNKMRMKIDGIIATVGDHFIMDSDIDMALLEIAQSGNAANIPRCEILGKLMEDKLYAHHAVQDSIIVSDVEIMGEMDEKIASMLEQIGTMDKLVKYYNKKSEDEFRSFFFDILKLNKLTGEMQRKIIDEVEITPEEVRTFFKKIPVEERPKIGAEMEVSQIIVQPKVSNEEKQKVIDKLIEIRREVLEDGASFTTKAVFNTQDPGSRSSGGYYKMTRKTPFVKEFKDVAFSLAEGEISMPFETEFGYHIIYLEKVRGQELDLRHILLMPRVSDEALKEAKEKALLIKKRIDNGELSFEEAARSLSDEKETRANGGVLLNPKTLDKKFELTRMDPELYRQVSNLKEGEVSIPLIDEDQRGIKRYKLMTVKNRTDEHIADYAKDYTRIKEFALKEKQFEAIAKWSDEKVKSTYVKINGEYRNCDFMINWLKK